LNKQKRNKNKKFCEKIMKSLLVKLKHFSSCREEKGNLKLLFSPWRWWRCKRKGKIGLLFVLLLELVLAVGAQFALGQKEICGRDVIVFIAVKSPGKREDFVLVWNHWYWVSSIIEIINLECQQSLKSSILSADYHWNHQS
jgi:hypothetical protein